MTNKTKQKQQKKTFTSTWGYLRVFGGICGGHLFNVLCYALFFFGFYFFFLCFLCLRSASCVLNIGSVSGLPFLD
jgi:hypothetical protein